MITLPITCYQLKIILWFLGSSLLPIALLFWIDDNALLGLGTLFGVFSLFSGTTLYLWDKNDKHKLPRWKFPIKCKCDKRD